MLRSTWIRVAGSALLLALLLAVVDVEELAAVLAGVAAWVWPLAVATFLIVHLFGVAKWCLLLRVARVDLSYLHVARYYFSGLFGNIFLPSIIGGDLVRTAMAIRRSRRSGGVLLAGVADRFLDFLALLSLATVGAWLTPEVMAEASAWVLRTSAVVVASGAVCGVLLVLYLPLRRLPRRLHRTAIGMRRSLRALLARPAVLLVSLTLALVVQGSMVGLATTLSVLLGYSIPLRVWLFVWPLAKLSALVPVTQGGIGIREATQVVLLVPLGIAAGSAVAVGLSFQAIVVVGGLCAGVVALLLGRFLGETSLTMTAAAEARS